MIARHWHGWTSKDNADAYESLFRTQGSNVNLVDGRIGAYLLRRDLEDEVEFIVVHIFESMDGGDEPRTSGMGQELPVSLC